MIRKILNSIGGLGKSLRDIFRKPPLPIEDQESLSRFVRYGDHIRKSDNTVKYQAFLPAREPWLVSVFRTDHMTRQEITNIKTLFQKPSVKITAILKASSIGKVAQKHHPSLQVVPEESQYKWHADIANWPEQKALRKTIAKEFVVHVEQYIPEN